MKPALPATLRVCPDLALQSGYLKTLEPMTPTKDCANHLILTGDCGRNRVFALTEGSD